MKNFIINHKRLTIGIILYIAVFIVSSFISPWQIRDVNFSDLEIDHTIGVVDKVPLKIIYFGIYELVELLVYAGSESFTANGLMFFITVCALFSYTYIIRSFVIKNEFDSKAEEMALDFIYDNIFAYISSVLAYFLYSPIAKKVYTIMNSDKSTLFKILTVLIILFFVIIPSLPQLLQLLAYVFSISWTVKLLVTINETLKWNIILKTILIVLVGAVLIVLINLIINGLLDKMQEKLVEFFGVLFPAIGEFLLSALRICVKVGVALLIFSGVSYGLMWLVEKLG